MKNCFLYCCLLLVFLNCYKDKKTIQIIDCNIQDVYSENAKKVTITNGVWGTVSSMEGDCMPVIQPSTNSCKTCAVKRLVKIYEYTLLSNAISSENSNVFFDRFNTPLVAQVTTDEKGFYQVTLPAGQYSIVVVENGKLYANSFDGQGGINPLTFTNGRQNFNITMTYKAAF